MPYNVTKEARFVESKVILNWRKVFWSVERQADFVLDPHSIFLLAVRLDMIRNIFA